MHKLTSLDFLADYTAGNANQSELSPAERELIEALEAGSLELPQGEYTLTKTINIQKPCVFGGNGATLRGADTPTGIYIMSSGVTVRDLVMEGFKIAVDIDPQGQVLENVLIDNIQISLEDYGVMVGSSFSNGVARHIHIQNCVVTGSDGWVEDELALSLAFNACAAKGRDISTDAIHNCLLEDVWFENNSVLGGIRVGFNLSGAYPSQAFKKHLDNPCCGNVMKGIHYIGNYVQESWDGAINVMCSAICNKDSILDGFEMAHNKLGFGITSLYFFANEGGRGYSSGGIIRNAVIRDNTLTRVIQDVGEPTRGLFIAAARTDYYPNTVIKGALMENVEICGNTLDGAGIVLCGAYALLDGEGGACEDNLLRNVSIHDNTIRNADYAFIFEAAQLEGRRYDWNFGYPRHEKKWADPIEDDSVVTTRLINNRIEDVLCENNTIEGFRYRVLASGADIRGHGAAQGNQVCKNIVMRNNHFGVGENHVRVADYIGEDFCQDLGGNKVDERLKNR